MGTVFLAGVSYGLANESKGEGPPDNSGIADIYHALIGLVISAPTASAVRSSRSPSGILRKSVGSVTSLPLPGTGGLARVEHVGRPTNAALPTSLSIQL